MKSRLFLWIPVITGFGLAGMSIINSCTHEPENINELEQVCYTRQVEPILLASCAISGCHNSSSAQEGLDVSNYESVLDFIDPGNAKNSKLYQSLTKIYGDDLMPPGNPLSAEARNIILVWIEQGAKHTTCDSNIVVDSLCFVQDIKPIITSNCALTGCHDAITNEEGYNFSTYNTIMADEEAVVPNNPGESKLYKVLFETGEDRMPPSPMSPLSDEQKEKIRQWIADGALNSDCPSTACDTSGTISFASQVWPAINASCVGCHNPNSLGGGVNLSNYSNIYNNVTTKRNSIPLLLGAVRHEAGFIAMPPGGKLEDCTIRAIEKWIEQGAANN